MLFRAYEMRLAHLVRVSEEALLGEVRHCHVSRVFAVGGNLTLQLGNRGTVETGEDGVSERLEGIGGLLVHAVGHGQRHVVEDVDARILDDIEAKGGMRPSVVKISPKVQLPLAVSS